VLESVNVVRKELLEVGKAHAMAAKNASTKAEALEHTDKGVTAIENIMTKVGASSYQGPGGFYARFTRR
jgi:hypothetical protein